MQSPIGNFRSIFGFSKDQLSLSNASQFLEDQNSLDNVIFFVNQVQFKEKYQRFDQDGFKRAEHAFRNGARIYGVKIIRPLRVLLLRVLNQNLGFIHFHVIFLQLCKHFSVLKEALPILEYPGFFKNMAKTDMADFFWQGSDIYIKLNNYQKAFDLISRASRLDFIDSEQALEILPRAILLGQNLGTPISSDILSNLKSHCLMMSAFERISDRDQKNRIAIIQLYLTLDKFRQLTVNEKQFLLQQNLLDLYNDNVWADIRNYIKNDIKQNNWRIKAESIKDQKLSDVSVIKGINRSEEVYRYDCKNGIMYFNHIQSNQEKLSNIITQACLMSEEVAHCKIERKEREGFGGMGFGGMGGMRFGGMGGMGMGGMRVGYPSRRGDMEDEDDD